MVTKPLISLVAEARCPWQGGWEGRPDLPGLGIWAYKGLCFLTSHLGLNEREWATQARGAEGLPSKKGWISRTVDTAMLFTRQGGHAGGGKVQTLEPNTPGLESCQGNSCQGVM